MLQSDRCLVSRRPVSNEHSTCPTQFDKCNEILYTLKEGVHVRLSVRLPCLLTQVKMEERSAELRKGLYAAPQDLLSAEDIFREELHWLRLRNNGLRTNTNWLSRELGIIVEGQR